MAILNIKQKMEPCLRTATGYIKQMLSSKHVVMSNGDDLETTITGITDKLITSKLLYYNKDGTTGTFTLLDNSDNYDYVEVFYNSDVSGHKAPQKSIKLPTSQKVSSGAMLFDMLSFRYANETTMQMMNTILNITGSDCKFETSRQINFSSTAGTIKWTTSGTLHHRVYRVVGYKYGS